MKRTKSPMHRYGEPDFDRDYPKWGFHDLETQLKMFIALAELGISGYGELI